MCDIDFIGSMSTYLNTPKKLPLFQTQIIHIVKLLSYVLSIWYLKYNIKGNWQGRGPWWARERAGAGQVHGQRQGRAGAYYYHVCEKSVPVKIAKLTARICHICKSVMYSCEIFMCVWQIGSVKK